MQRTQVYLIGLKSAYLGAKCSHSIVVLLPPPQVNEGRATRRQWSRNERRRYTLDGVALSFCAPRVSSCNKNTATLTQRLALDTVVVRAVHPPPFSSSYLVSSLISSSLVSCLMPSPSSSCLVPAQPQQD